MKKTLYAAYGSNLHPIRMTERLPTSKFVGVSYVGDRGFRFNKVSKDCSSKGNIIRINEGVHFAIYELAHREKLKLDEIEGKHYGYNEEVIDLPGFGECSIYIADETAIDNTLLPYSWYKLIVLLGCEFHNFPTDYISKISQIDDTTDSDQKRHFGNMALAERIENGT